MKKTHLYILGTLLFLGSMSMMTADKNPATLKEAYKNVFKIGHLTGNCPVK